MTLRAHRALLIAGAITVVIDAATKIATVAWLDEPVSVGPITLRLVYNPGVAFGLGDRLPTWALLALTAAVTALLAVMAWRGTLAPPVAAGMIVAGAGSNVVNRAIGGTVIDTFDLGWWPVFNAADAALCIGLLIVVIASLRSTSTALENVPEEDRS